ncbi:MAG: FitA-like ribbon-helix-helix domain-containing protein [Pseudolabrys sp.]
MVDILVRNVDEETARRLKEKAKAEGASLSDAARELLKHGLKPSREELVKELDRIRGLSPYSDVDSTDLIRADRDNDEPYR